MAKRGDGGLRGRVSKAAAYEDNAAEGVGAGGQILRAGREVVRLQDVGEDRGVGLLTELAGTVGRHRDLDFVGDVTESGEIPIGGEVAPG